MLIIIVHQCNVTIVRMGKSVMLVVQLPIPVYFHLLYVRLNKTFVTGRKIQMTILIGQEGVEVHLLEVQVHPMHTMEHIIFTSKQAVL